MKILAVSGSPKKDNSSTHFVLNEVIEEIQANGLEVLHINLNKHDFEGCEDCGGCRKKLRCSKDDDFTRTLLPQITDSDIRGVIFASPVYFGGVTSKMKMFFDRTLPLRRNGFVWENCVAGAVTVGGARNGGQEFAALDIIRFAMIQGMVVVPDASPTSHFGGSLWSGQPDGLTKESKDVVQARNLGKKVAEITKLINNC